ncbi:Snl1p KNAG_0H02750 [Huiozyma naganishii CBS 8797]|uniref:BAG domain-containing protein n=1 Tax=Huiozyma naganishii (strain ATCC MYA-139 / BCRC 22969 / CBS 8797 / KCTC 17520 / NBRC 10181 / NCYC 3082 / Yp74L-3) TaxID=1071383 RepID=J7R9Y5_HUIN7|nr:hypothetical protein KNAG_0H02750 [Kazachstania naganishii CBS 8797]CCK71690.1 hypothetical protein KNAG_0H02750 [Kazachstania naganishii CBS 8797]
MSTVNADFLATVQENANVIALTTVVAIFVSAFLWASCKGSNGSKKSAGGKKPAQSKKPAEMTLEAQIENVRLRYVNEFQTRIASLKKHFDGRDEKNVYERNYCNEMLLKLMIQLDGIDLVDVEQPRKGELKLKRKEVIRLIQGELKVLDELS